MPTNSCIFLELFSLFGNGEPIKTAVSLSVKDGLREGSEGGRSEIDSRSHDKEWEEGERRLTTEGLIEF